MITKMKSVLAMATVAMMVGTVWPSLAKTNELGWRKHSAYANQLYHRTAQWRWGNLRMARPGAFARMQEPGWREHYPYAGQAYSRMAQSRWQDRYSAGGPGPGYPDGYDPNVFAH